MFNLYYCSVLVLGGATKVKTLFNLRGEPPKNIPKAIHPTLGMEL
jgi:hypothetical protein